MARYVALLRAVNVGGTGTLPMADLKGLCEGASFRRVETYIASGNVVFETKLAPSRVKAEIEARLRDYAGKPIGVAIRTAEEMAAVLAANPFPAAEQKFVHAIFLDETPSCDALKHAKGRQDEEMQLGRREIFVHYPSGAGRSKLRIPAAKAGTSRNMNTVAKLVELAQR
jgi:uncharacterized protein (DUF1697 family)